MNEAECIPLRAEAEKLLEVADYLAYNLRRSGLADGEPVRFDLPGFGIATVLLTRTSGKITLEFAECV